MNHPSRIRQRLGTGFVVLPCMALCSPEGASLGFYLHPVLFFRLLEREFGTQYGSNLDHQRADMYAGFAYIHATAAALRIEDQDKEDDQGEEEEEDDQDEEEDDDDDDEEEEDEEEEEEEDDGGSKSLPAFERQQQKHSPDYERQRERQQQMKNEQAERERIEISAHFKRKHQLNKQVVVLERIQTALTKREAVDRARRAELAGSILPKNYEGREENKKCTTVGHAAKKGGRRERVGAHDGGEHPSCDQIQEVA